MPHVAAADDVAAFVGRKGESAPVVGEDGRVGPGQPVELAVQHPVRDSCVRADREATLKGRVAENRQRDCVIVRQLPHGVEAGQPRAEQEPAGPAASAR